MCLCPLFAPLTDFHSTDKYNRPIFVQDLGHLQIDSVFEHTTSDRIVRFFAINLEDAVRNKYRICTEDKRQAAREAGVAEDEVKRIAIDDNFMILNIEGLGMGTFWSVSGPWRRKVNAFFSFCTDESLTSAPLAAVQK